MIILSKTFSVYSYIKGCQLKFLSYHVVSRLKLWKVKQTGHDKSQNICQTRLGIKPKSLENTQCPISGSKITYIYSCSIFHLQF